MKIYIKEPGRPALRILIPNSFLTGKIVQFVLRTVIQQKCGEVPGRLENLDLKPYTMEVKKIGKQFKGLYLVDIQDAKGTVVKIRL